MAVGEFLTKSCTGSCISYCHVDVCKFGQSFKLLALYGCKKLNCKDELKYNFHVTRSCYDHAARSSHILKDEE